MTGQSADAVVNLERRDWRMAIALGAAFIVLTLTTVFVATACGSFHDDAIYLSTAKSLAEGRGYHQINLPGSPAQTKYPVLYPLLLAVIWKVWPRFPENLWLMQGLTVCLGGLATTLMYAYLVRFRYASRQLAFAATAIAVTTPLLLFVNSRLLSEMPFAVLLAAALWRVELAVRSPANWRSQVLTGVIVGLPYLCRSAGIVLPVAALLVLAIRRRPLTATIAGIAIAVGPWLYWSLTALGQWQQDNLVGYYTDYVGSWSVVASEPGRFIGWNLVYLPISTFGTSLLGLLMGTKWLFGWRLATILLLLGTATWLLILWRALQVRLLAVFLASYGALLLLWPWPPARFILPILPFLLTFAGESLGRPIRRALPTLHPWVFRILVILILGSNLVVDFKMGSVVRETQYPFAGVPDSTVEWRSYESVFSWLRANTLPSDRIASALDGMVFLYTGRQSFRPFRHYPERLFYLAEGPKSGTAGEVWSALTGNRAKFLVVLPIPGFEAELSFAELVAELRRTWPDRFVPRYVGRDPRFMVFEVR